MIFILFAIALDLLSRLFPGKVYVQDCGAITTNNQLPFISVILPCYCEEKLILKKLQNVYDTTLSSDQFEVIVGLDKSPDRTEELVRTFKEQYAYSNLRLEILANEGKSQAINRCIEIAKGSIVISIDVDTIHQNDAFRVIANRFVANERLGCLSCVPQMTEDGPENAYWKHEIRVRAFESRRGLMPVVTGWLFAVRRVAYIPVPKGVMSDDFWIPMAMGSNGWEIRQDERVIAESHQGSDDREYQRRKRVCRGGIECIRELRKRRMIKPLSRRVVLFLHKQAKWLMGFWCGVFTACTILLLFLYSLNLGLLGLMIVISGLVIVWCRKSSRYVLGSLLLPINAYIDSLRVPSSGTWKRVRS
jgi:cellulose synthase/poly-beta-1,6-N-acetylglucosamine synthase-like glycosyltransferase